jgi:hypothetical protein
MKIIEIIQEGQIKTGRGELRPSAKSSIPNLKTWDELDNNNNAYAAYRYGLALAGAPDLPMKPYGPIGGRFTTIGYSEADNDKIRAAQNYLGIKPNNETGDGSYETDLINVKSPVKSQGPIRKPK